MSVCGPTSDEFATQSPTLDELAVIESVDSAFAAEQTGGPTPPRR
jgi:hypothetical protein